MEHMVNIWSTECHHCGHSSPVRILFDARVLQSCIIPLRTLSCGLARRRFQSDDTLRIYLTARLAEPTNKKYGIAPLRCSQDTQATYHFPIASRSPSPTHRQWNHALHASHRTQLSLSAAFQPSWVSSLHAGHLSSSCGAVGSLSTAAVCESGGVVSEVSSADRSGEPCALLRPERRRARAMRVDGGESQR